MSSFLVQERDERPVSKGSGVCFYCRQPIGQEHALTCVCRTKLARIRLTIELNVVVPEHWDSEHVEFKYNKSPDCLSNILRELEAYSNMKGCLCGEGKVEYVKDVQDDSNAERLLLQTYLES